MPRRALLPFSDTRSGLRAAAWRRRLVGLVGTAAVLASACGGGASPEAALPTVAATAEVRTVCLAVVASFADVAGEPPEPAVEEVVRTILESLDVAVVAEGSACDAGLRFAITFRPLAESYSQTGIGGGMTCYAGAAAEGEATLALSAGSTSTQPLAGRYEPPGAISGCPDPAEAPFDSVWRRQVLEALGVWWGLPALVAAMQMNDTRVAGAAGGVMADMGADASPAVPFLMGILGAADPGEPAEGEGGDFALAAAVIVQISPEAAAQAMPRLTAALEEGERSTRLAVIRSLGKTASPVPAAAVDALVLALRGDEDPYLRAEAATMLGQIGPDAAAAVPALIASLDDRGAVMGSGITTVAAAAALALGAIGDTSAIEALLADLERGGRAALQAMDALEAMGPAAAPAVPALVAALQGDHRASASVALQAITGQYDYADGEVYLRWWHSLECAATGVGSEVRVTTAAGPVSVVIEEAQVLPASFEDRRPCGVFSPPGCRTAPPSTVVAEGQFLAVRYTLENGTEAAFDLPGQCSHADPRRRCSGEGWWLTDGGTSWPAVWWDVWAAWVSTQGRDPDPSVDPGQTVTDWAVFDVPEGFQPVAIAWPLEDDEQVCLTWP